MAGGLLSPLLSSASKLLDLLRSRPSGSCPPPSGRSTVSADVQRLERLLRRIQATLDDAGEREVRDSSVKLWIEELTDLAYDAEDVLDDHRYELLRRHVQERQGAAAAASSTTVKRKHDGEDSTICEAVRKITRRFEISADRAAVQLRPEEEDGGTSEQIGEIAQLFKEISTDGAAPQLRTEDEHGGVSERIREITSRFEEISRDRAALHLGPEIGDIISGRDSWRRLTSHLLDESLVFGRSKEKERIIESVLSFNQRTGTHCLPIVGMGGVGKTTVAQMVYNDDRVQNRFDLHGWVHVSQTFDLLKLTNAVTESLTRKQCEFSELSCVHNVLKEEVNAKDVFLVLDDLWNEQQDLWFELLRPLKDAQRVTILVTTRSKVVACLVQSVEHLVLGILPEDHCWLLFQHYAFGNRIIDEGSTLVQVGRKIMKKCGGLPLAVKSIGCMLRFKMDVQTWMEILESEFWESLEDHEEIFSALRLSFYRLPAKLKPCFLLCTLYPKGHSFTKDDMIHLWIAHGCIHPRRCEIPEKVAGEYFDELNERSLIETDLYHSNDHRYLKKPLTRSSVKISSDQLLNTCQYFVDSHVRSSAFCKKTSMASSDHLLLSRQWFRLHDMTWDLAKSLSSHVLSVRGYDKGCLNMENKVRHLSIWQVSLGYSKVCHNRQIFVVWPSPDIVDISVFTRLKSVVVDVLGFCGCILPFMNLKHLRYLSAIHRRKSFQNEHFLGIRKRLESLETDNNLELCPEMTCHLYSLEKLIIFAPWHKLSIKHCNLISLRYLQLSVQDSDWSLLHFCELHNLDTLCLHFCSVITEFRICIGSLVNLRRLQLSRIPNIEKLSHDSFLCQNNKCQSTKVTFPALEELEFDGLRALESWSGVQDSDYPKVQNITIRNCCKLRRIPYFSSVKKLILSNLALRDLQLSVHNAPSQLQILDIRDCENLTSLMGLKALYSLGSLYIAHCPDLIVSPKTNLPYKPHLVFIDECLGLIEWCDEQDFHYQGSQTKVSYIKKAKDYGRDIAYFKSFQHLALDICPEEGPELVLSLDNWLPSEVRLLEVVDLRSSRVPSSNGGLSVLRRLEIRGCPKLQALVGLEKLRLLNSLVLADCPLLHKLPEMKFPPRLTSLVVHGCHKLISLHLNSNHSTWIELEVSDCQGLMRIGGLGYLTNLESLVLLHCRALEIQELLPVIPEFVAVFLCPKLKKWCEIQSIEYVESLPDSP